MAEMSQSMRLPAEDASTTKSQQQAVQMSDVEGVGGGGGGGGQQTGSRLAQPPQPARQKKSSFQITSVTVGSRLSNDGGEDSADDLDESHTEDLSSDVLDISKVTDYEYSSEEAFSSTAASVAVPGPPAAAAAVTTTTIENQTSSVPVHDQQQPAPPVVSLFATSAVTSSGGNANAVSVTVVESPNLPLSAVQHPEIQWQNRFRVVKIETSEPFRRGRWLCMDFLDPPPPSSAQSELGETASSMVGSGAIGGGGGGGGAGYGNSGSGNSSGTGSMQHGDSMVMDPSAMQQQQQQHPSSAVWSADSVGYAAADMTHGMGSIDTATPIYPVSIILQTQQQGGNLDFTNTALHMQARTAAQQQQQQHHQTTSHQPTQTIVHGGGGGSSFQISAVNPSNTSNEFHVGSISAAPISSDLLVAQHQQQQQQQQQQHQMQQQQSEYHLISAPTVSSANQAVQQATTDYIVHQASTAAAVAPTPPAPAVVQMVQMDVAHHQSIGANPAQSQSQVFQQCQQPVHAQSSVNVPSMVAPLPPPSSSQQNVAQSQQPSGALVSRTQGVDQRDQGQQQQQQQPPLSSQLNQNVATSVDPAAGVTIVPAAQEIQVTGSQLTTMSSQNGDGTAPATAATSSASSVGATTTAVASPPVQEASSAASGEEGDGESLKVLAASLEDGVRSSSDQCHGPPSVNAKYSASGASTVAIDNKIEQAMDLVKSHLMFAVREEVDVLKERITELMDRIGQLEYENSVLRASASPETLAKLSQPPNPSTT